MKRFSVIIMSLLVIGFIAFGCAPQLSDRKDEGWITLIDGPKGLENWNQVGSPIGQWWMARSWPTRGPARRPASWSRRTPTATFRSEPNSGSATTPTAASTCVVPMPTRSPTRALRGEHLRPAPRPVFWHGGHHAYHQSVTYAQGRRQMEHL